MSDEPKRKVMIGSTVRIVGGDDLGAYAEQYGAQEIYTVVRTYGNGFLLNKKVGRGGIMSVFHEEDLLVVDLDPPIVPMLKKLQKSMDRMEKEIHVLHEIMRSLEDKKP